MLNEDKRRAIEIIVEEQAEARDPEDKDGDLPGSRSRRPRDSLRLGHLAMRPAHDAPADTGIGLAMAERLPPVNYDHRLWGVPVMKVYDAASIRNVALVGHSGSGKTQLVSAMLFDAGMVNRFGKVDDGTTVTDYDEEEIARKHTLVGQPRLRRVEQDTRSTSSTRRASATSSATRAPRCSVADAALVVVDAVAGVEVQTEKVWAGGRRARPAAPGRRQPARSRAREPRAHARRRCARRAAARSIPIQLPIGEEKRFRGVVDLVAMKALRLPDRRQRQVHRRRRCPPTWPAAVDAAREALIEMVAEADETLMEKFFEAGTLTDEELVAGLRSATIGRQAVPAGLHVGAR